MLETIQPQPDQMAWEPTRPSEHRIHPVMSHSPSIDRTASTPASKLDLNRQQTFEIGLAPTFEPQTPSPEVLEQIRIHIIEPQREAVKRAQGSPASLAMLLLQHGDTKAALNVLETANDHDYWTHHLRGLCVWYAGEMDAAERAFRDLVARYPEDARALHVLGRFLFERQEVQESIDLLLRARSLDATPSILNDLGAVLLAAGRAQDALAHLRFAIRVHPNNVLALANCGVAHYQLSHRRRADDFFRRALAVDPLCNVAVHNLSESLVERKRWQDVVVLLTAYVGQVRTDGRAYELLAWAYISQGSWREAQTVLETALHIRPGDAGLLNNLATVQAKLNRGPTALQTFQRALELSPENSQIRANVAHMLAANNQWSTIPLFLRESDVDGVSDRAFLLAHSLLKRDLDEAVRFLFRIVKRFEEVRFVHLLGNTLASRLGRPEDAIAVYSAARSKFGLDPLLMNNLGYALILAERFEEARAILAPLYEQHAQHSDDTSLCIIASFGLLQIREGSLEKGLEYYRAAFKRATGLMKKRIRQKLQVEEGAGYLDTNFKRATALLRDALEGPDPEFQRQARRLLDGAAN